MMLSLFWMSLFLLLSLELWLLLQISLSTSLQTVVFLCGISGVAGLFLLRGGDFSLWNLLALELRQRRPPTEELLDALLLLVSGGSLVLTGVISDLVGLGLLIPPVRESLVSFFWKMGKNYTQGES